MMGVFLCGWPATATSITVSPGVAQYCRGYGLVSSNAVTAPTQTASQTASQAGITQKMQSQVEMTLPPTTKQIYVCASTTDKLCDDMKMAPLSSVVTGTGFIPQINNILMQAVKAVQTNQPMPAQALSLMQLAPFPLYQAVNAAAVYPSAGMDLLDSLSVIIGEQLASTLLDQMLSLSNAHPGQAGTYEQAQQVLRATEQMRSLVQSRQQELAQNIVMQQQLAEQIRILNQTIQQKVLSPGLLGNAQYGQALYTGITPQTTQLSSGGQ
jgi:hypothetical protein